MADDSRDPGREALRFNPGSAAWVTAEVVARPPSWLSRAVLYGFATTFAAALIYAYLVEIPVVVSARGTIGTSAAVLPIRANATGRVAVVNAREGTPVAENDLLIEMEELISPAQAATAAKVVEQIERLVSGEDGPHALDLAEQLAAERVDLSGTFVVEEYARLTTAREAYRLALASVRQDTPRAVKGLQSEGSQIQAKLWRIRSMGMETALANDVAELTTRLSQINSEVETKRDLAKRELASARAQLRNAGEIFREKLASYNKNQRLTAPTAGTISQVTIGGRGELVSAGQQLMVLIPSSGELRAEVLVANKDIAHVREGMMVNLKLDAFPYQDYGVVTGRVLHVPHDVDRDPREPNSEHYRVIASVDRSELRADDGAAIPLRLGMTLNADIKTRERSILRLALFEILRLSPVSR